MKKLIILLALLLPTLLPAQIDSNAKPKSGMYFNFATSYDVPMADMAKRFGNSYTLGGGFVYKTPKNIFFQAFGEFIMGNTVKQKGIYTHIGWSDLQIYDLNGNLRDVLLTELGLNIGIGTGKTIVLNKTKSLDNGINLMTSLSLLQHRINHVDNEGAIPQAISDYAKGYDYLSNGLCINQSVSYLHLSKNALTNFMVGINARFGFTRSRRSVDFATGVYDDRLRNDILIGLQFKWFIALFKNVESDVYF